MLAAMLAILFHLKPIGIVFLVFLAVVVSLLALCAYHSNLDSCVISHIFRHLLNKFARTQVGRSYLPRCGMCARFRRVCRAQQKSPVHRGRVIIPLYFLRVKGFFDFFLLI